jgi:hypothetical protein
MDAQAEDGTKDRNSDQHRANADATKAAQQRLNSAL